MKLLTYAKRINKGLKVFKQYIKYGGCNSININSISWEEILKEKTILITGGGSGIGLAIAQKCSKSGAKVIIAGRNEEKLRDALNSIKSDNTYYMVWDISATEKNSDNVDKCIKEFGDIDILINNAAVGPKEFFPDVTEKEWDRIYDTNSKGTFFLTEEICKRWMKESHRDYYKKIINIDSQGGFFGATYPYRMSKWDIRGMTKGLGLRMAPYKVLVNGIAPGVVKTEMQKFAIEQGENTYCTQNPLERVCLPDEVADLAVYMSSDACNFMVGQVILIDGGATLN